MKVTLREGLIYALLTFYIIYAFAGIGITGLIFSLAIGLILLSFNKDIEIIVASIILSGLGWKFLIERRREGFTVSTGKGASANEIVKKIKQIANQNVFEGFNGDLPIGAGNSAKDITRRLEQIKKKSFEPSGLLSSSYAEGFEDASNPATSTPSAPEKPAPTASSSPAPTNAPTATAQLAKDMPKTEGSNTAGFADKITDGMFKLGSVPPDSVGGAHIDIGTTMMNALNALKPDQVKQMTDDTRKLLETQKSLMGMLSSMKPMLQDGKQLMGTFNDMFGKGMPGMPSMPGSQ
jgi:hypothetical protein